ncbi:MAG: hypothetical protein BLM47_11640 [Candidatus Reconcilbacillus cellulovorans]|uniref:ATP-dependent DNA ligase family profile domain-containing protein n=1 Tax=Candidatus Reconcilbacillus cellulovorans TaxID=1906605 RepID=A0A2A6DYQ3_9BACL|nr:MAG: hypothetical protein BLM47_11640 [Candidatus Reconcilbacillus cellulovorans]
MTARTNDPEDRASGTPARAPVPPREPMAPIPCDELPSGPDWAYQLKWDGVRLLAVTGGGAVRLFSRRGRDKTNVYPELREALSALPHTVLLDGEAVVFDPARMRPDFHRILRRERTAVGSTPGRVRALAEQAPATYAVFDLLHLDGRDLRGVPLRERHERLLELLPRPTERLLAVELFPDGQRLWRWVEQHGWEGVVGKRLSSPYREGKRHRDWFKKKAAVILEAAVVGVVFRSDQVASLVVERQGFPLGRVGVGLDERTKAALAAYADAHRLEEPPTGGRTDEPGRLDEAGRPAEPDGERVVRLSRPLAVIVSGLELTPSGQLRHPKLIGIAPIPGESANGGESKP